MIQVDWKDLPTKKKLIVNFEGNETLTLEIDEDYELVYIYIGTDYYCTNLTKIKNKIKTWLTLEEKSKEKGSRVYLDFSESELEELQELLKLSKTKIEIMISDSKEETNRLRNNVKKFQDKFSKVEF